MEATSTLPKSVEVSNENSCNSGVALGTNFFSLVGIVYDVLQDGAVKGS